MRSKILISFLIVLAVLFGPSNGLLMPASAYAKIVCTQEYGQPVVCVEEEGEVLAVHEPVEAGILDNLLVIGTLFIVASRVFVYLARKKKAAPLA
jgi:hypothetical protein